MHYFSYKLYIKRTADIPPGLKTAMQHNTLLMQQEIQSPRAVFCLFVNGATVARYCPSTQQYYALQCIMLRTSCLNK